MRKQAQEEGLGEPDQREGRREEALARYRKILPLLDPETDPAKRCMLREQIALREEKSVRTIYRYERQYREAQLAGLLPKTREKRRPQKLPENWNEILIRYQYLDGSTWHDYLLDQQGSTMGIVSESGTTAASYTYSDFGETSALVGESFPNDICYTGGILDWATGEYYLNARYYDPENAVFLEQDIYRGDTGDYPQWNLYAYCAGDPINHSDPSGHWVLSIGATAKAAAIVGISVGVAVNVDSKGYFSITATPGLIVMTNAAASIEGFVSINMMCDSVDAIKGFGISTGVAYSYGLSTRKKTFVGVLASISIDNKGKVVGDQSISFGVGVSAVPIPYYEVKMGYTFEIRKYSLKKVLKWKKGKEKKVRIAGINVKIKKNKGSIRVKSKKTDGCFYIYPNENGTCKRVKYQK